MTDYEKGLSEQEVRKRLENGQYNKADNFETKSFLQILKDNVCTLFNAMNLFLAIAVISVGSYKNIMFMMVVIINALIGTIQELRAKRTIEKLSIVGKQKIKVLRDGKIIEVDTEELVLDDIFFLENGNQVPTDCVVIEGSCEVNESLLTGESDAVFKNPSDKLISGSFIVSGKCKVQAEKVGGDNYASHIFKGARYVKKVNSQIMQSLNLIIKTMSIVILPVGTLLFLRQYFVSNDIRQSVIGSVGALIGMIPEGLILLTSTVLAVGVIRLSKQKVLTQEMLCIETLARVDVLCLDKTGTITEGCMEVSKIIPTNNSTPEQLEKALYALGQCSQDNNPTINAIREKFSGNTTLTPQNIMPFSSEKKWSGIYFGEDIGTYLIGAEEFLLGGKNSEIQKIIGDIPKGYRVITVAYSENNFQERNLPENVVPLGIVVLRDKIRKEAKATLEYFDKQGVTIKVISGDNPETVSAVAEQAGVKNYDKVVDATTLQTEEDIFDAVEKYTVFGRVTPKQKLQMVKALQKHSHTVAMTGDGVNDVLALKEADCSIAMASGSESARCVAQLVLLDSNFASMPKVLAEGRRSINNIQRSASLFLVKTIFSTILAVIFVFWGQQYPFSPIQMTLVNAFCIGFPSFVLALEPNEDMVKGNFLMNILNKAVPGGITVVFAVVMVKILEIFCQFDAEFSSTLAVSLTAFTGLMVIFKTSLPFNLIRSLMFAISVSGMVFGITYSKFVIRKFIGIHNFFGFVDMSQTFLVYFLIGAGVSIGIFLTVTFLRKKLFDRFKGCRP
ncbi:MAG: cation-translocating P-type ATPase [Clostridia bacterium]|nr:cation-translocating P-type ATPase [Clostridia bacterium]